MAEKHKSKYKKPENKKPTYRKDLKDYTLDDKKGGLNPKSTGEKQTNVLRKTDKTMQDDGKLYPTYNDDDRLYKDLENGDYDPKTAAKRLKKRQDTEEKDVEDVLHDKIENLTREQKEILVREYVRRKIAKVLREQPEPAAAEEAPEETPAPEAPTPTAPGTPDLTGTQPTDTPTPDAGATPPPPAPPAGATPPAPEAPAADAAPATDTPTADAGAETKLDPEAQEALAIQKFVDHLREKETGNIARLKTISKVINNVLKDSEPEDFKNFFMMLKSLAVKKLQQGNPKKDSK